MLDFRAPARWLGVATILVILLARFVPVVEPAGPLWARFEWPRGTIILDPGAGADLGEGGKTTAGKIGSPGRVLPLASAYVQ